MLYSLIYGENLLKVRSSLLTFSFPYPEVRLAQSFGLSATLSLFGRFFTGSSISLKCKKAAHNLYSLLSQQVSVYWWFTRLPGLPEFDSSSGSFKSSFKSSFCIRFLDCSSKEPGFALLKITLRVGTSVTIRNSVRRLS